MIDNIFTVSSLFEEFNQDKNDESYVVLPENKFDIVISAMAGRDVVLIGLFCAQNFEGSGGFTLFYVFERRECKHIVVVQRHLNVPTASSVATLFPSACWFEREISDGFGIAFPDAFDRRPLFLHEKYPDGFHQLRKEVSNQPIETKLVIKTGDEYQFKEMAGEGVYQIPVGPVHAGIIEPGHFRFSVIGETIFNLEIRMFYKHRGIEKLAEGKNPEEAVTIAETISGDESVTNAFAFSSAVEKIAGITVPPRSLYLRSILLEMERIYSHLGDMAGMIVDVAFPRGASHFFILREEMFRQNNNLAGSRFLKGIICPGGLKKDITQESLNHLSNYLDTFLPRLESAVTACSISSVIDRLETTGVIQKELIPLLNITGPAARAAGATIDTRYDHPYAIYPDTGAGFVTSDKGDVMARFNVKAQEIRNSVQLIQNLIKQMPAGGVITPFQIKDGYALSLVEAARGQSMHWVYIKDGLIDRYKVRTASFCNWQAIEHAVMGNIVPDFPLINKSLNLSYAGTDL